MVMVMKEEMRKGPWTEDEDVQLMCFVRLFGERRWDFIAKVSGLQRTGKSCRLRWVNYLNPDLKRGRMSPQEERQVLELHARWGNRWSRIARRLPGRTDNEIKNYWRTHMRKKAQEGKKAAATLSSSSSSSTLSTSPAFSPSVTNPPPDNMHHEQKGPRQPPAPTSEATSMITTAAGSVIFKSELEEEVKAYPMEQIWEEIASSSSQHHQRQRPPSTLPWDYSCYTSDYSCCTSDPLWKMSSTVVIKEDAVPMIDNHVFLHPELPTSSLFQIGSSAEWK